MSDALRDALEKALPCDCPAATSDAHHRPWCVSHGRDAIYAAVAPLLASERAAREAAERDTERLDWLATVPLERIEEIYWGSEGDNGITREAIDAARSAVAKGDEG